jgi:hypothetical protein
MKLTNQDLDILRKLLEDKIEEIDCGPENEAGQTMLLYLNIINKLDRMYFL